MCSSPESLGSFCALLDEIKARCEIAGRGKRPGHSKDFTSATEVVLAEQLLPARGHQQQNSPTELGALVGPGLSQDLAAKTLCPWGPAVPEQHETQRSFSNYRTNPQGWKSGRTGRAGCLAGESGDDYSQPVDRAGLGKAVSEHPAFLGWEHELHPGCRDKPMSYGWILPVSNTESILPLSPALQNPQGT